MAGAQSRGAAPGGGSQATEGRLTVRDIQGADCHHLIADVALRKMVGGYLVECHGCNSALGIVAQPREFQALRRETIALEAGGEGRTTPYTRRS